MKQTPIHSNYNPDILKIMPTDLKRVVEVGCSGGALAKAYAQVNPNCVYTGVEIDSDFAEVAKSFCTEVICGNIENFAEDQFLGLFPSDCWIFGDALEHLYDPWVLLQRIRPKLSPDAQIIACIPNAQHWSIQANLLGGLFSYQDQGLMDRTHIRWFTRTTMLELFESAGYEISECFPRIFDEPGREIILPSIRAAALAIGIDPEQAVSDSIPLQWVIKAVPATTPHCLAASLHSGGTAPGYEGGSCRDGRVSGKTAAITMVKDECDIIELFVKINSRVVDHIFIIDHGSRDGTPEILEFLKTNGYPITVYRNESSDFQQSKILSTLARQVAAGEEYDYIVPLDADEFIYSDKGRFAADLDREITLGCCGKMRWVTYVPTDGDYYASHAPLYEMFRKRSHEPEQHWKVIIPNEIAKTCTVLEGNHGVMLSEQQVPAVVVTPILQHVPIRSVDQVTAKALIGSRRLSIKLGRLVNEGWHWDYMAERLRVAGYRLTRTDMQGLALCFAANADQQFQSVDETAPRVGLPDDEIQLRDLSRINLIERFCLFSDALCAEIVTMRNQTQRSPRSGIDAKPSPDNDSAICTRNEQVSSRREGCEHWGGASPHDKEQFGLGWMLKRLFGWR